MSLAITLRLLHTLLFGLARLLTVDDLVSATRVVASTSAALAGYHMPESFVNPIPAIVSHSATILALAALACAGLLLSILQRTKPSKQIVVLELMIASLTAYFLTLGIAESLTGNSAEIHRYAYILRCSAEMLRMAFFMFGGHFLALTLEQTISDVPGPSEGMFEERTVVKIWIAFAYIGGLAAMTYYGLASWTKLHTFQGWNLVAPGAPSSEGLDFFRGFATAIWLTVQVQILSNIYSQVDDEERQNSFWTRWHLSTGRLRRTGKGLIIGLQIGQRPREARLAGPLYQPDEFKAFLALLVYTIVGMILFVLQRRFRMMGADYEAWWNLKMELLPLAILFPLVYYKTRFVFFDVVIKRGIRALALIATVIILSSLLPEEMPKVLSWAIAAAFAGAWGAVSAPFNRVLDQWLFHRPDYGKLQAAVTEELPRFDDFRAATAHVTLRLREALHVPLIVFSEVAGPGELNIPVSSGDRTWGYLTFGERPRQQPYQSEDVQFLTAIAKQVAAARERIEQTQRERELRELAVRAELKALRAQINPHFFFNALNTVADLTQSNPAGAEKVILNLARIFQFALEATRQETIPLGREIAFVRSYLEIEKARFEEKLSYEIDVPDSLGDVPVPPMLIQPLVENAVRHGISAKTGPGCVTVRARMENDRLCVRVEDDGVGFEPSRESNGVGLSNVAQRVERLAGAGHWQVRSQPGAGASVQFDLEAIKCAC